MTSGAHNLERFIEAQRGVYATARAELCAGAKKTHWMWFIFPQLKGLGVSAMAEHYGIASLDEARAYLDHPVLGPRLIEAVDAILIHRSRPLNSILAPPDDLKFRSSMTLFAEAARPGTANVFEEALAAFCAGQPDTRPQELLMHA